MADRSTFVSIYRLLHPLNSETDTLESITADSWFAGMFWSYFFPFFYCLHICRQNLLSDQTNLWHMEQSIVAEKEGGNPHPPSSLSSPSNTCVQGETDAEVHMCVQVRLCVYVSEANQSRTRYLPPLLSLFGLVHLPPLPPVVSTAV